MLHQNPRLPVINREQLRKQIPGGGEKHYGWVSQKALKGRKPSLPPPAPKASLSYTARLSSKQNKPKVKVKKEGKAKEEEEEEET